MSDLQRLHAHGIAAPATGPKPGYPPALEWLALRDLRIDPSYQREITSIGKRTIAKIVAAFEWALFSPLIVAPVPGTKLFAVIDGQHRATAALILGVDRVPCSICKVAPADQARIFAGVNGVVTRLQPLQLYKAALVGGEAWALGIRDACEAAGIKALLYPKARNTMAPFETQAVGTLRQMVERHGADVVGRCLAHERRKAGADEPGYWNSPRIKAAIAARADHLPAKPSADTLDQIGIMKARGYTRTQAAAILKLPYSEIERHWGAS